jgi:hypothetical protein
MYSYAAMLKATGPQPSPSRRSTYARLSKVGRPFSIALVSGAQPEIKGTPGAPLNYGQRVLI